MMSLATSPNRRAYRVVEYTTADGVTLRFRVSPEVAAVLADEGPALREMTLTDLAGMKHHQHDVRSGLDPERVIEGIARRVARRRTREARGNPWTGPRHQFGCFLGETRPNWLGGEAIDDEGVCRLCRGRKLSASTYCLSCDRSGRDDAIPTPGERVRRRAPKPARSRSGKRLAGGVGR
jgi:hypothetical protein